MSEFHKIVRTAPPDRPFVARDITSTPASWAGVSLRSPSPGKGFEIFTYLVRNNEGATLNYELWLASDSVKVDDDFDPSTHDSFEKVADHSDSIADGDDTGRVSADLPAGTVFIRVDGKAYIDLLAGK